MDEAVEVDGSAVPAGGDAAELHKAAKASPHLVAMFVDGVIVRDGDFADALEEGAAFLFSWRKPPATGREDNAHGIAITLPILELPA